MLLAATDLERQDTPLGVVEKREFRPSMLMPISSSSNGKRPRTRSRPSEPDVFSGIALSGHRLDPFGKPRELSRNGILVQHAFGDAAMHFGLRGLERRAGGILVARGNRDLDALNESANPRDPRVIDNPTLFVTTDPLLGG